MRRLVTPFLLLIIGAFVFSSCIEGEKNPQITVKWKHLTNFTNEEGVFESEFTLEHNGGKALSNNWALFFNMMPRQIKTPIDPQLANIEHINGDWYKMVPGSGFQLDEGDAVTILYRGEGFIIKDIDRPLGLYFVYYDEQGEEEEIVKVQDYKWEPLYSPTQINRNQHDFEPIPIPSYTYRQNLGLSVVEKEGVPLILPTPLKLFKGSGHFGIQDSVTISYPSSLENEYRFLRDKFSMDFGITVVAAAEEDAGIRLGLKATSGAKKEAYELIVSDKFIEIIGADPAGVFYGIQSLRSLVPVDEFKLKDKSIEVPQVQVVDAPSLAFRSLHLDVGRNFQSKETILKLLDIMSFYKLNHFLFYLTEDEGWRIEIDGMPELTEVCAHRSHSSSCKDSQLQPAYGSGPFANDTEEYSSGFYSKSDFIEILQYAADRHITVIPQVNFPGHARAAIKAMENRYERLMKEGKEIAANEYRLIDPDDQSEYQSPQGYKDNVVCVVRESAYRFYEKVFDEIKKMYDEAGVPLTKFHMGGDEVPAGAWTNSPMVVEFLKNHPEVGGAGKLHAYFVRQLLERLTDRSVEWHGWEEIALQKDANGAYHPNPEFVGKDLVPYIWNNLFDYPDIGYRLANEGYPVVLCNVSNLYFDLAYTKDPAEPGLYWGGFIDVKDTWSFAPYNMYESTEKTPFGLYFQDVATKEEENKSFDIIKITPSNKPELYLENLNPSARNNIVGIQAQLWSETIKGEEMLEYYYLPKLIGFSESAWCRRDWEEVDDDAKRKEMQDEQWNTFVNKLASSELPRLSYIGNGYNYRLPPPGIALDSGMLFSNVEYPGLMIRYTTDGTDPSLNSELYSGPIKYSEKKTFKFRSFDASGKASRVIEAKR